MSGNSDTARGMRALVIVLGLAVGIGCDRANAGAKGSLPDAAVDSPLATSAGQQTAVFAGGCFWGVQAVFQHVKGVTSATSGYAGGPASAAQYETVSTGETGHAESVKVTFDPAQVSYGQLLKVFFAVAHDPTQLNRQGPDTGTQYRSAIFYTDSEQERVAQAYIAQLQQAKVFSRSIVTQVTPLKGFYPAEKYHQNYATIHPADPYIFYNDAPKVENLRKELPALYAKQPVQEK